MFNQKRVVIDHVSPQLYDGDFFINMKEFVSSEAIFNHTTPSILQLDDSGQYIFSGTEEATVSNKHNILLHYE